MPYVIAVDDEVEVLSTLKRSIERDGLQVMTVSDSSEAEAIITAEDPDLVILDIVMPDIDGIQICKNLRNKTDFIDLPILFLTAKGRTDDVVAGLDAGADDYIIKPFHVSELRARVTALLRRSSHSPTESNLLQVGAVTLDSANHEVRAKGVQIRLTATEHRLLRYLMGHPNKPQSPALLLETVWDYPPGTGDPDLVRAHVRNLRSKLKKVVGHRYIETVHGVGYVVSGQDEPV